jgi:hypothetical protein
MEKIVILKFELLLPISILKTKEIQELDEKSIRKK